MHGTLFHRNIASSVESCRNGPGGQTYFALAYFELVCVIGAPKLFFMFLYAQIDCYLIIVSSGRRAHLSLPLTGSVWRSSGPLVSRHAILPPSCAGDSLGCSIIRTGYAYVRGLVRYRKQADGNAKRKRVRGQGVLHNWGSSLSEKFLCY